jgi:hypothetical protein
MKERNMGKSYNHMSVEDSDLFLDEDIVRDLRIKKEKKPVKKLRFPKDRD